LPEAPPDLFGGGYAIEGEKGALALEPPLPERTVATSPWTVAAARALAQQVHDSFAAAGPSRADCLAHARRCVERAHAAGHEAAIVLGLVDDGGRAYPHAWVRVGLTAQRTCDVDPTLQSQVDAAAYLPFGASRDGADPELGQIYIDLTQGARRVIRVPVAP
jgi:hypothetical protein